MMLTPLDVPGCLRVAADVHHDARGSLAKPFVATTFAAAGVWEPFRELFHSSSHAGVVRGMHVALPPDDGVKLVACEAGEALDVLVDLRRGSPVYGRAVPLALRGPGDALVVAAGVAHGFAALTEGCLMSYATAGEHATDTDAGVRWDSFGFAWPFEQPLVSERDAGLPALAEFESPFVFEAERGATT
jgi:dTDP-4-dehydrorhamnose 3,5-epimerase